MVGNRGVREGAYAAAGAQLLSLVPARGLWVDANFKESQLAAMRPGQPATVVADVLPGETFAGRVASLAPATGAQFSVIPAENATGNFTRIVQRVPVRILLDGDGSRLGRLRPGLSVTATVDLREPGRGLTAMAAEPAELSPGRKVFAFAVMCVGFFIALLDIQIVSSSLQDIGGGLSASRDELAWVQTSYLIAEIVVIPLSGWLSRVMSTRWLFCASAAGFTATSLLCGWAWDIESMIAFRALQGFLGGSMIPTVFTAAFAFFPGPKITVAAATDRLPRLAGARPSGPRSAAGSPPATPGTGCSSSTSSPGPLVAILVPLLVRIDKPDLSLLKGADYLGMVLMALFLGSLEYVLEEGPRWDWFGDATIRACAWIALVAGIGFVWRSLTFANPVVDLRALREPQLRARLLLLLRHRRRHLRHHLPDAALPRPGARLRRARDRARDLLDRRVPGDGDPALHLVRQAGRPALAADGRARLLRARRCGCSRPITHDWGWRELLLPQALRGFAQQFAVAPTVTLTLGGLPPARLKLASGLFNLMRNLGGAIGIAACGTILNDRANLHFLRLAEHLTPARADVAGPARRHGRALRRASSAATRRTATTAALERLWSLTWREAQVLTYADAFLAVAACFALATAMVPLMRKPAPRQAAAAAEAH